MHTKLKMFSLAAILLSFNLSASEPYGSHTADKWQIWAYSSAAPAFIGDNAAIIGAGGKVKRGQQRLDLSIRKSKTLSSKRLEEPS